MTKEINSYVEAPQSSSRRWPTENTRLRDRDHPFPELLELIDGDTTYGGPNAGKKNQLIESST